MPSARSGYKKQMTLSGQLLVAQSTLATTSAPRVWAVNAVRISHTTTSILKVWVRQVVEHIFSASVTNEEWRIREQGYNRTLRSSTSHYFPFLRGTRTPYSCCLQKSCTNFILLHCITELSRRQDLSSTGTFLSGKPFLISVTCTLCTFASHYLCKIYIYIPDSSFLKRIAPRYCLKPSLKK